MGRGGGLGMVFCVVLRGKGMLGFICMCVYRLTLHRFLPSYTALDLYIRAYIVRMSDQISPKSPNIAFPSIASCCRATSYSSDMINIRLHYLALGQKCTWFPYI